MKPVASACLIETDGDEVFRDLDETDTAGIDCIMPYGEPDLEAIALAKPDLIITDEDSFGKSVDDLEKIAPVVVVQVFGRPLTAALADFATAVGAADKVTELAEEYDAALKELQRKIGDDPAQITVSAINAGYDPGTFVQADAYEGGAMYTVLGDLGVTRPADQQPAATGPTGKAFSFETLTEHDADALLVIDHASEPELAEGKSRLVASPLYPRLAAVRAEQAHEIDGGPIALTSWEALLTFVAELDDVLTAPNFDRDVVSER